MMASNLTATFDVSTSNRATNLSNEDDKSFAVTANFSRTPMVVMLTVSAVCSNLLVMICIVKDEKLHRPANYYVFSLSVIEGLTALIPVNCFLIFDIFNAWPLGQVLCKVC